MLKTQEDIISTAKEHQKEDDVHYILMHASERTKFPINSYMFIQYENSEQKVTSKIYSYPKGPFKVVNYTGSVYMS